MWETQGFSCWVPEPLLGSKKRRYKPERLLNILTCKRTDSARQIQNSALNSFLLSPCKQVLGMETLI